MTMLDISSNFHWNSSLGCYIYIFYVFLYLFFCGLSGFYVSTIWVFFFFFLTSIYYCFYLVTLLTSWSNNSLLSGLPSTFQDITVLNGSSTPRHCILKWKGEKKSLHTFLAPPRASIIENLNSHQYGKFILCNC